MWLWVVFATATDTLESIPTKSRSCAIERQIISEAKAESFVLCQRERGGSCALESMLWPTGCGWGHFIGFLSAEGEWSSYRGYSYTAQVPDCRAGHSVSTGAGACVLELRCKHSHVAPGTLVWRTGGPMASCEQGKLNEAQEKKIEKVRLYFITQILFFFS